jgi:Ni/Fe-hydrogenase subunit HybB-like protein
MGFFIFVLRFIWGIGGVTALDNKNPWGLWVSFDLLFMVGLCVILYLLVSFVEWSKQLMEGLNRPSLRKAHAAATKLLLPLTVLGASVAIIHQASLGALYLIAPSKIHPLWYSPLLPAFFLVSSMYAGLSMVVVEGSLAHASKNLRACMDAAHRDSHGDIVLGFGKAAGVVMLACFLIRALDLFAQGNAHYLNTGYGTLFLTEMLGFVLLPCLLFFGGAWAGRTRVVKAAALLAVLGIVLNRFNVSLVAYNWQLPPAERYFPSLMEIGFSVAMVAAIVTLYRIFAAFLPMLREQLAFRGNAG